MKRELVYVTSDRSEFHNRRDAVRHEVDLARAKRLRAFLATALKLTTDETAITRGALVDGLIANATAAATALSARASKREMKRG